MEFNIFMAIDLISHIFMAGHSVVGNVYRKNLRAYVLNRFILYIHNHRRKMVSVIIAVLPMSRVFLS